MEIRGEHDYLLNYDIIYHIKQNSYLSICATAYTKVHIQFGSKNFWIGLGGLSWNRIHFILKVDHILLQLFIFGCAMKSLCFWCWLTVFKPHPSLLPFCPSSEQADKKVHVLHSLNASRKLRPLSQCLRLVTVKTLSHIHIPAFWSHFFNQCGKPALLSKKASLWYF